MGTRLMMALAGAAALTVTVSACSGVPGTSAPRVVKAVGSTAAAVAPPPAPAPDATPQQIVTDFLKANVSATDDKHAAAKQFLTAAARSKWSDTPVTVLQSDPNVQTTPSVGGANPPTSRLAQVTISGANKVGSLSASGIYTPVTPGDGTGTEPQSFSFTLRQDPTNQWRIDQLPPGLILTRVEFDNSYREYKLYFGDSSSQHLVADPRYSPLDQQSLASWLLAQLLAGPRPELQTAVNPVSDSINPKTATVVEDLVQARVSVELPGSSSLDPAARKLLAAQLVATFDQTGLGLRVLITDDGKALQVGQISAPYFAAEFPILPDPESQAPTPAYYLSSKGVLMSYDGSGQPRNAPGPLGQSAANKLGLLSVALARANNPENPVVAATTGSTTKRKLEVGTLKDGLAAVDLQAGPLTRPVWAPTTGAPEVWVGDAGWLYRIQASNPQAPQKVSITLRSGPPKRILAVSFSPDGVRMAVVAAGPDDSPAVYVGTVERSALNVRVDNLEPVSQAGVSISDVAWNDDSTLYMVGSEQGVGGFWSVLSDGNQWRVRNTDGLVGAPVAMALAPGQVTIVQTNDNALYAQVANWVSLSGTGSSVLGSSPSYLS